MTAAEARAVCAALQLLPWDDAAIARAITGVTASLIAASPRVTPVAGEPGLWWVGASGFDALGGEPALARRLSALARRWHPRARVGIAGACVAARAATWAGAPERDAVIVPPGGDALWLAAAPLALVPMPEELRDTLAALGIRTAGALATLEAEDVERRWGNVGLDAWRLARADDHRRPVLARAAAPRAVEVELPAPVDTMAPVLFLARAAIETLAAALARDGRAAAAVAITLALDDARGALPRPATPHTITREVRLPRPTARAALLFDHCRALLDQWPLGAPACGVTIAIVATAPASGEQGDLLSTAWRDVAAMDAAFARLRAELGAESVVRPVAREEHRVERAGAWREAEVEDAGRRTQGAGEAVGVAEVEGVEVGEAAGGGGVRVVGAGAGAGAGAEAGAVLRLLEEPEGVEVERERGVPCAVWWRGRRIAVEHAAGPERLSGDWWTDPYRRDYWRCDGEGAELLLFADHEERWYVQGWYD